MFIYSTSTMQAMRVPSECFLCAFEPGTNFQLVFDGLKNSLSAVPTLFGPECTFSLRWIKALCSFYKNGSSANFFSCACNVQKFKELFTPMWNGIAASVRCVSSAPVVLKARLPD